MDTTIRCPKCGAALATIASSDKEIRTARCAGCGFCTGWLRVPDCRTPRSYLRERLARVARAYRLVRGLEGA